VLPTTLRPPPSIARRCNRQSPAALSPIPPERGEPFHTQGVAPEYLLGRAKWFNILEMDAQVQCLWYWEWRVEGGESMENRSHGGRGWIWSLISILKGREQWLLSALEK